MQFLLTVTNPYNYIINPTLQTLVTCPLSIFIFTIKLIVDSVKMMTDF